MSRCFPYTPPGYAHSDASKEALIESIKLQKETEKTINQEQRKERKKEKEDKKKQKEEKRKEKNEKRKAKEEKGKEKKDRAQQNVKKSDDVQKFPADFKVELLLPKGSGNKKFPVDVRSDLRPEGSGSKKFLTDVKGKPLHPKGSCNKKFPTDDKGELVPERSGNKKFLANVKGDLLPRGSNIKLLPADVKGELLPKESSKLEPEQLERSTLTEEHGQAAVQLRVPSTSSDSTENSNKRKRQSSPSDVTRVHSKIIRIRLSSKKQNEPDESTKEQLCSTSGRTDSTSQDKDRSFATSHEREIVCSTSKQVDSIAQDLSIRSHQQQICSTSQQADTVDPGRRGIPVLPTINALPISKMQKMEMKYQNLFGSWVPPPLLDAPHDSDDLDWLFSGKKDMQEEKWCIPVTGTNMANSISLWPQAQFLQEVGVYVMPYTVPF